MEPTCGAVFALESRSVFVRAWCGEALGWSLWIRAEAGVVGSITDGEWTELCEAQGDHTVSRGGQLQLGYLKRTEARLLNAEVETVRTTLVGGGMC